MPMPARGVKWPGPQAWSAFYPFAGPQVRNPHLPPAVAPQDLYDGSIMALARTKLLKKNVLAYTDD